MKKLVSAQGIRKGYTPLVEVNQAIQAWSFRQPCEGTPVIEKQVGWQSCLRQQLVMKITDPTDIMYNASCVNLGNQPYSDVTAPYSRAAEKFQ